MHAPLSDVAVSQGQWFVLLLEPQREFLALTGLHQRNVTAWLPAGLFQRRIRGKLVDVRRPLLGPYLFVQCHRDDLSGLMVVPGVCGVLPHGREPEPVPSEAIDDLRTRELAGLFRFTCTVTGRRKHRRLIRSFAEMGLELKAAA
jgi:transcription antitermination factor NusG